MTITQSLLLAGLLVPLAACSTQPNALDYMLGQAPEQQHHAAYEQGRIDQHHRERYTAPPPYYDQYGHPVYHPGY